MLSPLDVNVNDSTLWTIALVVVIICGCLWILSWILGRWRP
jgi:hypothetical protein